MKNLPLYLPVLFGLTTLLALFVFSLAAANPKRLLKIIMPWLLIQALVALSGFYTVTRSMPPRFILLLLPPLAAILVLFNTETGKRFVDALNLKTLTLFHAIRLPVELFLLALFVYKSVPAVMTFEGRNFDIFSGITAPFVYYFGFIKKKLPVKFLLLWNIICLALLVNIVVTAILSVPAPFQRFGFDQPNMAILYFPFVWLPSCVVPLVLLAHLAAIRQLIARRKAVGESDRLSAA